MGSPGAFGQPDAGAIESPLHKEVLEIFRAIPQSRPRKFNAFYQLKTRFFITQRHFPYRLMNFVVYLAERGRVTKVHYFPPAAQIDANGSCRLRCPSCITGLRLPAGSRKRKALLKTMKAVIDKTYRRSLQISFHHHGEPLLNEDFFPACAYAVSKGLWTVVHSSLNTDIPELGRQLIEARLCSLVVSCDGASQDIYEKYRRGGDVEKVFQHMRDIDTAKKAAGSRFPWITAKYIVFDHNWREMKDFRERALACGADDVLFVTGFSDGIYATGRAATEKEFNLMTLTWETRKIALKCPHIWTGTPYDYDGGIFPCPYAYSDEHLFAEPKEFGAASLSEQWNNNNFQSVRKFFLGKSTFEDQDLPAPCNECEHTRQFERFQARHPRRQ